MGRLFNFEGPVIQFLIKVFDIIIVNCLCLLCSIPVVTIGAASTAMYAVCFKIVNGDSPQILKEYFGSFKSNFKQATVIWMIFLIPGLIIWLDIYLLLFAIESISMFQRIISAMLAIFGFVWLIMILYVFPLLSRFENTTKQTIINSYLIPLSNPVRSLALAMANLAIVLISIFVFPAIAFGASAAINVICMNKIFKKYVLEEVNEGNEGFNSTDDEVSKLDIGQGISE